MHDFIGANTPRAGRVRSPKEKEEQAIRLLESYIVTVEHKDNPWELTRAARHLLLNIVQLSPQTVSAFLENTDLPHHLRNYFNAPICLEPDFWTLEQKNMPYLDDMINTAWVQRLAKIFAEYANHKNEFSNVSTASTTKSMQQRLMQFEQQLQDLHDADPNRHHDLQSWAASMQNLVATKAEALLALQAASQLNNGSFAGKYRDLHNWLLCDVMSGHEWFEKFRATSYLKQGYSVEFDDIAEPLLDVVRHLRERFEKAGSQVVPSKWSSIMDIFAKSIYAPKPSRFEPDDTVSWKSLNTVTGTYDEGIGVVRSKTWYSKANNAPGQLAGWSYCVRKVDPNDFTRLDLEWFNEEQLEVDDWCCPNECRSELNADEMCHPDWDCRDGCFANAVVEGILEAEREGEPTALPPKHQKSLKKPSIADLLEESQPIAAKPKLTARQSQPKLGIKGKPATPRLSGKPSINALLGESADKPAAKPAKAKKPDINKLLVESQPNIQALLSEPKPDITALLAESEPNRQRFALPGSLPSEVDHERTS